VTRQSACLPAGWTMKTSNSRGQTIGETLDTVNSRLGKTREGSGLDAQLLLARLIDRPRSWLLAHPEAHLPENKHAALEALVTRLEVGEPLPYILGTWEFFNLEFELTPAVLIPRPETELLVERAIAWLRRPEHGNQELTVMDVGTGSGCIAISLAVNMPELQIIATDISPSALIVARRNAEKFKVTDRIYFSVADLFPNSVSPDPRLPDSLLPNSFSLIVTNPPYIPTKILHKTAVYGHEPTLGLDGGSDGLALVRRILAEAPKRLIPGGLLLMEIEASAGPAVLSLAEDAFPKARIQLLKDLAGRDRLLEVQV
jgi:release factor glutamine methyltransferase